MKTNKIIILLMSIALIFALSCEKDVLNSIDNDQQLDIRARGENNRKGKPDKEDPVNPLFSVTYDGPIVTSTTGYGHTAVSNPKYELLNATECGSFFTVTGINTLTSPDECFESSICSPYGVAIRQWDKKQLPGRVSARFFFQTDACCPEAEAHWFGMHGTIDNNGTTIFPATENSVVTITFDTWWLDTGRDCRQEEKIPFASEWGAQHITIRRIDNNGVCPETTTSCP